MSLEIKRKRMEMVRLDAARAELEFSIEERLHDIERLKKNIDMNRKAHEKAEQELTRLEGVTADE